MEIRFFSNTQTRGTADAELPLPVVRVPDLSGRILGARYSLRRRIGGGSLGTVYEARDMTLGTAVAVKVMHPEYSDDESFRRRFHQEALIGARLRHEHSVAVTDLGQSDDGLLYSVMEYLEGESLDALLSSRSSPLPWRRVVLIASQVCAALQAAHDRGIIHRDIKPGNCFLVRREGRGVEDDGQPDNFTFIKVLDLGLARVMPVSGRPTPPGRLGAPEYLAPEQIQGGICDHRVDLYALGVMMYALLARRLPFVGDNPAAIMRQHIEATPPSLRRVAPDAEVPASLEAVVLRALAKDPAERFPSAFAMAQAIHAAAAETETEAIAIDESLDDPHPGIWRRLPPPATIASPMSLAPVYGYGPTLRTGLVLVALAFVGICAAVTQLWTSNRELFIHEAIAATMIDEDPAPSAEPTARRDDPVTRPRPELVDLHPLAPIGELPLPVVDLDEPPWADLEAPATPPAQPALEPEPEPVVTQPRAAVRRPRPAAAALPLVTPGFPLERTFRRLADSIAPGVHRCMRLHVAELDALTVELTIGGPRHTAVELGLKGSDSPALRACLAPLIARIHFPASERTGRFAHTYRP